MVCLLWQKISICKTQYPNTPFAPCGLIISLKYHSFDLHLCLLIPYSWLVSLHKPHQPSLSPSFVIYSTPLGVLYGQDIFAQLQTWPNVGPHWQDKYPCRLGCLEAPRPVTPSIPFPASISHYNILHNACSFNIVLFPLVCNLDVHSE
jgi:hypothetical protein